MVSRRNVAACIPDAESVAQVWSCTGAEWLEQLTIDAPSIFSDRPVLLNIGANKGYSAPHFLSLWSQHPNATIKSWRDAIRGVARGKTAMSSEGGKPRRHGFLATQMCGACGACRTKPPPPHLRDGGRVHLVEMTVANSKLLNHLAVATDLQQLITVHNVAVSNESGMIYSPQVKMGTEFATAPPQEMGTEFATAPPQVKMGTEFGDRYYDRVQLSTVDDLVTRYQLPRVIDVLTIDAEGHDPLVLEGMSAVLRDKRVTLLEFEYHSKGFWNTKHPNSRTLERSTSMLGDMGYRCYLEGPPSVYLPINQGCWRARFERHKWSNVFCTHDARARAIIDARAWAGFDRRSDWPIGKTRATVTAPK